MAGDFARQRAPQSDTEFVVECQLPEDAEATRVALAVRRSVAKYGMIEASFIRAVDRYPDELIGLSGWDSIDFLGWIFELEHELGERVSSKWFDGLPDSFSVRDLARCVYRGRTTT